MRLDQDLTRAVLLAGACLALAACGGESTTKGPTVAADGGSTNGGADGSEAGSDDAGGAATGARSSGGGANGGATGSGGSEPSEAGAEAGGAATGGSATGGSATGGLAQTGGSATGGSATGGLAQTGGASAGGEEAGGDDSGGATGGGADAGGAATGGLSTAGAPAAGGAGGATSLPDTACGVLCAKEQAAGCTATGTTADCLASCRLIEGFETCEAEVSEMLDCAANATTSCDTDGEVVFEGCEVAQLAVVACIESAPPPEELVEPCTTYCDARAELACPADDPSTCITECGMVGNIAATCTADWIEYLDCAAGDELVCNDGGEAEPVGCTAETLTALACITAEVQGP